MCLLERLTEVGSSALRHSGAEGEPEEAEGGKRQVAAGTSNGRLAGAACQTVQGAGHVGTFSEDRQQRVRRIAAEAWRDGGEGEAADVQRGDDLLPPEGGGDRGAGEGAHAPGGDEELAAAVL